jgi:hypothetical protein
VQKTVLSIAVATAVALPGLAAAQAASVPTLDKVLEASGISLSGYVDTAYSHANRDIEGGFSTRVFDSQNNSFALHQVGVQIAKQPKEGFGGLVNFTAGKDAGVMHSSPANEQTFDITQGFLSYATGPWHVMAGKFATLHGTEVIWSPSNPNFSRSLLFGAEPFTHTGVRAHYELPDTATFFVGINNGWDQLVDQNRGKSLEVGVTATPIKPLTLTASAMDGQEFSAITSTNGRRDSINLVGSYTVTEPFSVGLEFLNVKQKDAVFDAGGGMKEMKYDGFAAYVSYLFVPKLKGTLRAESFNDKDGFHFGNGSMKYKEYTLTVAYLAADSFELRGEVRNDKADNPVFRDGGSLSDSLTTFAVQALYKF